MRKRLGLSAMNRHTPSAPLAALGSRLPPQDCFAPLREHVQLDGKTVFHAPHEKRLDVVVSMLADCASLKQINPRLRPQTALAAAWGRDRFADQSTLTRVLDALTPRAVAQLRTAVAQIYRREGQALHHPLVHDLLCLDIDLRGLPAGRRAEASTKGYCSGEKTAVGANSPGSAPRQTRRVWCRWSIPATRPGRPVCAPRSPRRSGCWAGRQRRGDAPCAGSMAGWALRPTATGPSGLGTRGWPQGRAANGRTPRPGPFAGGKSGAPGHAGWRLPPHRGTMIGAPRPRC
jgi:hypothetical protein